MFFGVEVSVRAPGCVRVDKISGLPGLLFFHSIFSFPFQRIKNHPNRRSYAKVVGFTNTPTGSGITNNTSVLAFCDLGS